MKYRYLTCCVHSTAEKIGAMVDAARIVSFRTVARHCADLHEWARSMSYAVGAERGLHLKDDWAVSYYKSCYDGQPCYYIAHSAIEHIFTPQATP
jgi:hypothetical protein